MVFFKFIELYQKKGVNSDILGKILQYLILPCFSNCYKKGEKEQLLCTFTKTEDNLIIVILNKVSYLFEYFIFINYKNIFKRLLNISIRNTL